MFFSLSEKNTKHLNKQMEIENVIIQPVEAEQNIGDSVMNTYTANVLIPSFSLPNIILIFASLLRSPNGIF